MKARKSRTGRGDPRFYVAIIAAEIKTPDRMAGSSGPQQRRAARRNGHLLESARTFYPVGATATVFSHANDSRTRSPMAMGFPGAVRTKNSAPASVATTYSTSSPR
jgi:hypothetical protein